jgi:hypothetical protein
MVTTKSALDDKLRKGDGLEATVKPARPTLKISPAGANGARMPCLVIWTSVTLSLMLEFDGFSCFVMPKQVSLSYRFLSQGMPSSMQSYR